MVTRSAAAVRWIARGAAALLAAVLVILAIHTPPAAEFARARLAAWASRQTGTTTDVGHLQYFLPSLTFTADHVALSARTADRDGTTLSPPTLQYVFARRVVVQLRWRDLIRGRPMPWRVQLSDVDVVARARDTTVSIYRVSATMSTDAAQRQVGQVARESVSAVVVGQTVRALTRLDGSFSWNGESLDIDALHISTAAADLDARGQLAGLTTAHPGVDATGTWRTTGPEFCGLAQLDTSRCAPIAAATIGGRFLVAGTLAAPVIHLDMAAEGLGTGPLAPMALTSAATIAAGRIEVVHAAAQVAGGSIAIRKGVFETESGRVAGEVTWKAIQLRRLASAAHVSVPIAAASTGEAYVAGDPLTLATWTIDARATITSLAGEPSTDASLTLRIDDGRWESGVKGRIETLAVDGRVSGRVPNSAALWSRTPLDGMAVVSSFDLRDALGTARHLGFIRDVPSLGAWQGRGTARVSFSGRLGAPLLAIKADLSAERPGDDRPVAAQADVRVAAAGVSASSVRITRGADHVAASAAWARASGVVEGEFSGTAGDLSALAQLAGMPSPPVFGAASFDGRVSGTASLPQLEAVVRGTDVRVPLPGNDRSGAGHLLTLGDMDATIRVSDRIDLQLNAPAAHLAATATVGLAPQWPFALTVAAEAVDVGETASAFAGEHTIAGTVDAQITASGRALAPAEADVQVQLSRVDLTVDAIPVTLGRPSRARLAAGRLIDAEVDARVGELAIRLGRAETEADAWQVAINGVVPWPIDGVPTPPVLAVDALVSATRIAVRQGSVTAGGTTADLVGELPVAFLNRWMPASWRLSDPTVTAPATFDLKIQALSIGEIARRLSPSVGDVDGTVDVVISATATSAELQAISADGRVERGRLGVGGVSLEQQDVAVLAIAGGRASITGWRWTGTGTDVTLRGDSTFTDGVTRFDVAAAGDVDLAATFAATSARAGGTAHFDVAAHNDGDGLTWTGDVELRDAAWVMRERGIAVSDTNGRLSCDAERCVVNQFTGNVNGGTLAVEGEVPWHDVTSSSALRLVLRGAGLEMPKGTRHDVDADLELTATDGPRVTGTVTLWPDTVSNSLVSLVSSVMALRTTDAGDAPGTEPSRLSQVPLDVRVVTGNDLIFDSHDLQLAASADLRLRGTLGAPQLRGRVGALERGRIFFGGRMWDLEEGTISLGTGVGGAETRLAATVSAKISRYAVRMSVSGPVSQPTLAMTSDPPLGQSDLAELVLTGQISGNATRAGGQQVASMVSGELLSTAGRSVGIDAVRIEQSQSELSTSDLEPVARLTVSKRLTGRSEIVYSQGLSDSDDQAWVLIYRPGWQSLDLRATLRTNGAEAYEMRQELEFGAPSRRALVASRPAAPIVSSIEIEGLAPDETAAVRRVLKLEPGGRFTTSRWQKDRQAVTQYFHDRDRLAVRVRASYARTQDGAYDLLYRIAPGPLTRIEVQGHRPPRKTLAALRDAWSRTAVEELLGAELTDVVRLDLAAHHYYAAEVETTFRPLEDDGRLAVITVSTGERARQHTIVFTGNANIGDEGLRQVVAQRGLEPRCWIEPSTLEAPIVAVYRSKGYLAARAATGRTVERGRATLTVSVKEGPLFTVGAVMLSGTTGLGEERVRAGLALAPGVPFTADAVPAALGRLLTAYARAGYLDAAAAPSTKVVEDAGVVNVTIAITEGPSSTLQEVRVTGRGETNERLVERAFDVQPGGPADPVALDEGQQRLYRTGIFRTVDVDLEPVAGAPAEVLPRPVEATVALEERARYRVRYGVQFGPSTIESITTATDTAEPGATFDLQRRNILGHGIVAGVGGVFSANQHRVRGTVSAATLRGRFVSSTFTIEQANQDREWNDGVLQVLDRSLRAVFEQRWRYGVARRIELAYGFEVDHRRVELQATSELLPLRANLADLNATVTFDSRDNRFNPRRGTFHSSRVEAGAGAWLSDLPFTRYQVQHYVYRPFGATTFASGVRFGTLAANDRGNPTTMLLFFKTGGATSVRGYETDSLTPAYALGAPVGGKVLLVLNEELRVPLSRRLGVVTFVDAGNTFTGLDTLSFPDLKVGAGVGLRFDTPVAVLRFDVALPLPQQPGGPRQRWYLSIGQAF